MADREVDERTIDEIRFDPDSTSDQQPPVIAEWTSRQLQRIREGFAMTAEFLTWFWGQYVTDQAVQDGRLDAIEAKPPAFMVSPYTPNQAVTHGAMVVDGGYLMHANKDTDERAAPQGAGPIGYLYNGTNPTTAATAKSVVSGNRWTFGVPAKIGGYRVYAIAGFSYSVYMVRDPDGFNELTELPGFTTALTGWREFSVAPLILPVGAVLELLTITNEPDETPVTWTGDWTYITPNNPAIPGPGEITQSNKGLHLLSINYLGFGAVDHEMELRALTVGDVIRGAGMTWVIQTIIPEVAFIDFTVSPAAQGAVTGLQTFSFDTVTATPIDYMEDPDYWLANQFAGATAQGVYGTDTITPALNDNAYGTDILAQNVTVSEDWDFMALSN